MSRSRHERGDFIREKMGLYILKDLGNNKIDAKQASYVDNLMRHLEASGVTYSPDLAIDEYYLKALKEWRKYLKDREKRLRKKGG